MWPTLPPYLRKVLELVVMGFTNADIGKAIGHSTQTAADYVKRLIQDEQYFKDPILILIKERGYSSRTALAQIGRQYLAYPQHPEHLENSNQTERNLLSLRLPNLDRDSRLASPQEHRNRLILLGDELTEQYSWEEALPVYRLAEATFGKGISNQTAWAACSVLYLLIDLGDYDQAHKEARRIQRTYGAIMDYETKAEFYKLRGWLNYYEGNFARAEQWFKKCLQLAQESGVKELGEGAEHFLGRLYCDWALAILQNQKSANPTNQTDQNRKPDELLRQSVEAFDRAIGLHRRWPGDYRGYDLLRKAQLRRVEGNWREADQLRTDARARFGDDLGFLHVDMEEARLDLIDKNMQECEYKAKQALEGWAAVKHSKGEADALQVLGSMHKVQGNADQALELYIAALCVFPFENHSSNRQRWAEVFELARKYKDKNTHERVEKSSINSLGPDKHDTRYQRWLARIEDKIAARQGYFAYLNYVASERGSYVDRIVRRLAAYGA